MKQNNSNPGPKAYDKPDQAGNIFNPADRIIKHAPFKRAFITDAYQFGIAKIPTICADTENPRRIARMEINANFCQYVDELQNPDVFRILKHTRYDDVDNEQARRESETPEHYIRRHFPELDAEAIKAKLEAKEYPADVGAAYEDKKIIQKHLHLKHITENEIAFTFMIDHIAKIARFLYESEDNEGKHTVCTLDVFDALINALPDIDFLAASHTDDNPLQFIRETLDAIGYTGYMVNIYNKHGGKFTGKLENDMTDKDIDECSAAALTPAQIARLLDANIDRIRRMQASGKQKAGAGE